MSQINYYDIALEDYEGTHEIRFFNIAQYSQEEFSKIVMEALKANSQDVIDEMIANHVKSELYEIYPIFGSIGDFMRGGFMKSMVEKGFHQNVPSSALATCHLDNMLSVIYIKGERCSFDDLSSPNEGSNANTKNAFNKEFKEHIGEVEFPTKGEQNED